MNGATPRRLTPARLTVLRKLHQLERPSLRDLAASLGHSSTNSVSELLGLLERDGFLRARAWGKARAYELTALGREAAMGVDCECIGRGIARCA